MVVVVGDDGDGDDGGDGGSVKCSAIRFAI